MNTKNTSFYLAGVMARQKELAIKAAINHWFDGDEWDESELEKDAGVLVEADGSEIFFISEIQLVRFGPLESKIDIEGGRVMLLFNQPILELY